MHVTTTVEYELNNYKQLKTLRNKQPVGCEAQLDWKCLFMATFWPATWTSKVG